MNEEKFTGKAQLYAAYRPSYPTALLDWLYEETGARYVADIGAGTGIFTQCLLRKFPFVTAVEPNADMRAVLAEALSGKVKIVDAPAEATTLASASVDLVTAAQAFHWFDKPRFKAECQRILKPEGKLAVIWNERVQTPFAEARNRVCMEYCGQYHSGHVDTGYADFDGDTFLRQEYFRHTDYFAVENPVSMTKAHFIGDTLSRSYAPKEQEETYSPFVARLGQVFDEFSRDGRVTLLYRTTCYLGNF